MGLCIMLEKLVHKNTSSYCVPISVEKYFYSFLKIDSETFIAYSGTWACIGARLIV